MGRGSHLYDDLDRKLKNGGDYISVFLGKSPKNDPQSPTPTKGGGADGCLEGNEREEEFLVVGGGFRLLGANLNERDPRDSTPTFLPHLPEGPGRLREGRGGWGRRQASV